jgi:hypothetical protein
VLGKVRNSNVDFVKFICAFGVLYIHTQNAQNASFFLVSYIGFKSGI